MNECQHWSATCTSLGGWSLTYREQSLTIWLVSGSPVDKDQESNGISKSQTRRHSGRSESGSKSSSPKNDASLQAFFFFPLPRCYHVLSFSYILLIFFSSTSSWWVGSVFPPVLFHLLFFAISPLVYQIATTTAYHSPAVFRFHILLDVQCLFFRRLSSTCSSPPSLRLYLVLPPSNRVG